MAGSGWCVRGASLLALYNFYPTGFLKTLQVRLNTLIEALCKLLYSRYGCVVNVTIGATSVGPGAQEETVATNLTQNFNTFINSIFLLLLYNNNVCIFGPEIRKYITII